MNNLTVESNPLKFKGLGYMNRIFISYMHQDQDRFNDVKAIRLNYNNQVDFIDGSLQNPIYNTHGDINRRLPSDPAARNVVNEIKSLLAKSSKLLVLIGQNTHSSEWVKWEIETFINLKNNPDILFMRVAGDLWAGLPSGTRRHEIYDWDINRLTQWVNS